jgi:hypothetical protein
MTTSFMPTTMALSSNVSTGLSGASTPNFLLTLPITRRSKATHLFFLSASSDIDILLTEFSLQLSEIKAYVPAPDVL